MAAALEFEKVSRSYRDGVGALQVLRDADLLVEKGEFVAVVGPSGCGKSTLLNIAGGLDRGYAGKVRVDGTDLATLDDHALSAFRARHVGFVFQSFNLLPGFSALENVLLPGFFHADARVTREHAAEALQRVGLGAKLDKRPGELSGGERQRVALARALCARPPLLLADEPTGNLDHQTGEQVIDLLASLNREHGMTLVVVTHEARVSKLAARVLRLRDGNVGVRPAAEHPWNVRPEVAP